MAYQLAQHLFQSDTGDPGSSNGVPSRDRCWATRFGLSVSSLSCMASIQGQLVKLRDITTGRGWSCPEANGKPSRTLLKPNARPTDVPRATRPPRPVLVTAMSFPAILYRTPRASQASRQSHTVWRIDHSGDGDGERLVNMYTCVAMAIILLQSKEGKNNSATKERVC